MLTTLDGRGFYDIIATAGHAIALWASARAVGAPTDPIADLTQRLRCPLRWSLLHPVRALRRIAGSR